jgi:hypothetical protein
MTDAAPSPAPLSHDEMLPPVRPPSAGFLVQLFVIPGVIVLLMVLVWTLVTWLPQMGNDVASNLKAIEGSGANRWQAAVNLANLLRNDSSGDLKRDRETAARLSAKLDEELTAKKTGEDAALFRVYLATALGEFYVDTPLPVLVRAIQTEESSKVKPSLRVAATRAVAVLSNNLKRETGKPIADSEATAAVVEASRSDESLLRTAAAFALGEMGGDATLERLRILLDDVTHPYTRYNAATALARRGEPAVVEALQEMLETQQPPETIADDSVEEQSLQRNKLVVNGLRAAADLIDANPSVDLNTMVTLVERLTDDESREVRDHAKALLKKIKQQASSEHSTARN